MELNREKIHKLGEIEDVKKFIIGGKAFLTLESKKTGRWFTFRIIKAKKDDDKSPFFVSLLTGSNNEEAYSYMGTIFNNDKLSFRLTKKSNVTEDALSYKAFSFFFNLLMNYNKIHEDMGVYHRGMCCVCGKALTTPDSIKSGRGPICDGRFNISLDIKDLRKKKLQKLNQKMMSK